MRAYPVSPIRVVRRPIRTTRARASRTVERASERIIDQIDVSKSRLVKEKELIIEDPETSQRAWETKDKSVDPSLAVGDADTVQQLNEIVSFVGQYDRIKGFGHYLLKTRFSVQHLTIFDAIACHRALTRYARNGTLKMTVRPSLSIPSIPLDAQTLLFDLTHSTGHTEPKLETIKYDINNARLEILSTASKVDLVGKFTYRYEDSKIEKIEGDYEGNSFFLDPVWNAGKHMDLVVEKMTLGIYRAELLRHATESIFIPKSLGSSIKILIKNRWSRPIKGLVVTTKVLELNNTRIISNQLFHPNIPIPISATIRLSAITESKAACHYNTIPVRRIWMK